jgi:hypothetical protein
MRRIVLKDLPALETVDAKDLQQVVGGSFSFGSPIGGLFCASGQHMPTLSLALPDLDAGANARKP